LETAYGGADVADVYYPAFLINGKQTIEYPDFKPGEKVSIMRIMEDSLDDFGVKTQYLFHQTAMT
jgi:hypothetical protein